MLSLLFIVGIASCVEAVSGVSVFKGSLVVKNASVELNQISLENDDNCCLVCGRKGSVVVVRGCVVGMGKDVEGGAFDLSGSIGVLRNITLKGWRRGGEIYSGRLFGGKGYGREKGGGEEKASEGGERGRGRGRGREGDGEGIEGSISVSESRFSSFCVSSAPFLSSPSIPLISLSHLTFFNISTANDACSPSTAMSTKTTCMMISCSFSSVCDAYDGGIVPSLNNPYASLTASNTSFIGCCRTRNVVCEGNAEAPLKPDRQNETFNGANTFTWCEWSGSRTTGESDSVTDGVSSGGAICMYNLNSGELSVSHCSFNDCTAYYHGGAVMCHAIKTIKMVSNVFNSCTAQNYGGGGMYACEIRSCALVSGCDFQMCKARIDGGGLRLYNFQVSGSGCIGTENGEGGSSCVFDCSFTSCSLTSTWGGGMYCHTVPAAFKMRSIQFISCSASANGGGLRFNPLQATAPCDGIYCYFLFFHECKCSANSPLGHDVEYADHYSLYLGSGNPFHECYTTNTDDQRVCYAYNYSNAGAWKFDQTSKKTWLNEWSKVLFVGVNGKDSSGMCGMGESAPCQTVGHAVETGLEELSLSVTLLDGNHQNEATTIEIKEKKISVIGTGKNKNSIGTKTNLNRSFSSSPSGCYFFFLQIFL